MLTRELAEKASALSTRARRTSAAPSPPSATASRASCTTCSQHNLSVMVVQACGARQVLEKDPGARRSRRPRLIERTGREALAEQRHLFGPVRRGDGVPLSGPPSIARIDELARRARDAG
jgi:hypothetical protein